MHNVDESAICYHKNGTVREYKLIKTEDLPSYKDDTNKGNNTQTKELFDPKVVKANALNILTFLKENCVKEGGTYWIFKDSETNQI